MKKRVFAIAVIVICLSILASTSLAYYTTKGTARNTITSGGIAVEVVEKQLVDGVLKDYPNGPNDSIPVMPTSEVSKIVSVKCTEKEAWVRMTYTVTVLDAEEPISAAELKKAVIIETDDENWIQKGDWWYYKTSLKTGETTKPLFNTVSFSGPDMDDRFQGTKVKVNVIAQAVQKANNGTTVEEAQGWA